MLYSIMPYFPYACKKFLFSKFIYYQGRKALFIDKGALQPASFVSLSTGGNSTK